MLQLRQRHRSCGNAPTATATAAVLTMPTANPGSNTDGMQCCTLFCQVTQDSCISPGSCKAGQAAPALLNATVEPKQVTHLDAGSTP